MDTLYTVKDYAAERVNDWCASCGDFGILRAMQRAFAELALPPEQIAVFGGIGCSGKTPYYLATNGIHTLHGRVLSFASGAKLAAPELTVLAVGGDGDGLSIGAGHFVNTGRRDIDLTYILFNNGVYGLTKGQPAPTMHPGEKTRRMASPVTDAAVNPLSLALVSGYSWIGRGYAYDINTLTNLLGQAIRHRGTSLLEVLQPCPTYNDIHTRAWYEGEGLPPGRRRIYTLDENVEGRTVYPDASEQARLSALLNGHRLAMEWGDRIPTGVFYRDVGRLTSHPDKPLESSQLAPHTGMEQLLAGLTVTIDVLNDKA